MTTTFTPRTQVEAFTRAIEWLEDLGVDCGPTAEHHIRVDGLRVTMNTDGSLNGSEAISDWLREAITPEIREDVSFHGGKAMASDGSWATTYTASLYSKDGGGLAGSPFSQFIISNDYILVEEVARAAAEKERGTIEPGSFDPDVNAVSAAGEGEPDDDHGNPDNDDTEIEDAVSDAFARPAPEAS